MNLLERFWFVEIWETDAYGKNPLEYRMLRWLSIEYIINKWDETITIETDNINYYKR
jgi:hypothetical protein